MSLFPPTDRGTHPQLVLATHGQPSGPTVHRTLFLPIHPCTAAGTYPLPPPIPTLPSPLAMQASRIAEQEGVAAITLHARAADQLYSPPADWAAIRQLAQAVRVPVIGNGDVYEGADAIRMIRETGGWGAWLVGGWVGWFVAVCCQRLHASRRHVVTTACGSPPTARAPNPRYSACHPFSHHTGCAGVMIGRGCLGRPWLFREAASYLSGAPPSWPPPPPPRLGEILQIALRHVTLLADWEGDDVTAVLQIRKLVGSYLAGFHRPELKRQLFEATRLRDWEAAVRGYEDDDEPFPAEVLRLPRLKGGGADGRPSRQKVSLPPGWLEGRDDDGVPDYLTGDACEG